MTDLAQYFDEYSRKARLYPALLVAMPVIAAVVLLWPGLSLEKLLPIVAAAGLPFFVGNLVRDRGKLLEDRLAKQWGGLPTTRMLRMTEPTNNPDQLHDRRKKLESVTGRPLPTAAEEQTNPRRADERYASAIRTLIPRIRQHQDRHPLVQTENTYYGFRRNLLALKPFAITLLLLLLVADVAAVPLGRDPQIVGVAVGVHLLTLLSWTPVRASWVRRQADCYAERLFEALMDPQLHESPTKMI